MLLPLLLGVGALGVLALAASSSSEPTEEEAFATGQAQAKAARAEFDKTGKIDCSRYPFRAKDEKERTAIAMMGLQLHANIKMAERGDAGAAIKKEDLPFSKEILRCLEEAVKNEVA